MFTGIVEGLGRVVRLEGGLLEIDPGTLFATEPAGLGESIAINGVCLTAVGFDPIRFDLSPETLDRTNLGELRPGGPVNLERAMKADARFGGHIVQGHVDATAVLEGIEPVGGDNFVARYSVSPEFDRYLIDKGSVALDGISLTVVRPESGLFEVWLIPHTMQMTNLHARKPGDRINVEFDVLVKHVEKLLAATRVAR